MLSVIQGDYWLLVCVCVGGHAAISNTSGCWLSVMGGGGGVLPVIHTRGCWSSVMGGGGGVLPIIQGAVGHPLWGVCYL